MEETETQSTTPSSTAEPLPEQPSAAQAAEEPAQPDAAETLAAMDHAEVPSEVILTVRMKRLLLFPVKDAEIKVTQGERLVETGHTDSSGQALFKLVPGDYTIASGDRITGISLQKNAIIKL